jgi:hypothetical protein
MEDKSEAGPNVIHMPAPTAWPMVLALGLALVLTGMVTSGAISLLGLLLSVSAGGSGGCCRLKPTSSSR